MDLHGVALVTRAGTVKAELAGGLAEAGRLALDDPVDRWLPGGPPQRRTGQRPASPPPCTPET